MIIRKLRECYSESSGFLSRSPSLTQQQFADEADINYLYSKYQDTGFFYDPFTTPTSGAEPKYGDFSGFDYSDFMASQNMLVEATRRFEALPLDIRKRFNYDPAALLEFVQDSKNRDEAIRLGLISVPDVSQPLTQPSGSGASDDGKVDA